MYFYHILFFYLKAYFLMTYELNIYKTDESPGIFRKFGKYNLSFLFTYSNSSDTCESKLQSILSSIFSHFYGMALNFLNNELKLFYFSSCYEGSSEYLYFIFSICVANYFLQIMKNFYLRLLKNNYFKLIEKLHGQFRIFPYLM